MSVAAPYYVRPVASAEEWVLGTRLDAGINWSCLSSSRLQSAAAYGLSSGGNAALNREAVGLTVSEDVMNKVI